MNISHFSHGIGSASSSLKTIISTLFARPFESFFRDFNAGEQVITVWRSKLNLSYHSQSTFPFGRGDCGRIIMYGGVYPFWTTSEWNSQTSSTWFQYGKWQNGIPSGTRIVISSSVSPKCFAWMNDNRSVLYINHTVQLNLTISAQESSVLLGRLSSLSECWASLVGKNPSN